MELFSVCKECLVQGLGALTKRAINIKLTCCMFITLFWHCLLSHFKASFHLFTAQHSKEWEFYIKSPFGENLILKTRLERHSWLWNMCHLFVQKRKDVKGVEEPQPTGSTSRYEPYWTYQVQDGWLRNPVRGGVTPPIWAAPGRGCNPTVKDSWQTQCRE